MAISFPFEQESGSVASSDDAADRASAVEEYQAMLRTAEHLLDEVDRALASLDSGDYGTCEECGTPIEGRMLEENPLVTRCASHEVAAEG